MPTLVLLLACAGGPPGGTAALPQPDSGSAGALAPCPASPNCVSSQAPDDDATHHVAPLPDVPRDRLLDVLEAQPRAEIVVADGDVVHVVFTTRLLRFRDDVHLSRGDGVWHVRSASRLGYGDMGVNRRRVEALRTELEGG